MESLSQAKYLYESWEDHKAGMYRKCRKCDEGKFVSLAVQVLSSDRSLINAVEKCLREWPVSSSYNLKHSQNPLSWFGQAACCITHQCPERQTRVAWGMITSAQRDRANELVRDCIERHEAKNSALFGQVAGRGV